jgi:predicted negative regulator of RcsB-dependent stress response
MAKKKGLSKKELRAPDEFQIFIIKLTEKYGRYWKIAVAALILIIAIPIAITGYNYYKKNKENQAASGYTMLTNSIKNLDFNKKISKIDQFIDQYSDTHASFFALLLKGKLLIENKKFKQAINVYNQIIANSEKDEFKNLAKLNLAICYYKIGQMSQASSILESLKNSPIVAADATFYLAQIYEKEHKLKQAKILYQEIIDKYKNYPYYRIAQIKKEVL